MFGSGIYSTVVSSSKPLFPPVYLYRRIAHYNPSEAGIYAKNHGVNSKKHVLILCGIDPGKVKTMEGAGNPGLCDSVCSGSTYQFHKLTVLTGRRPYQS
jgi:hypothetical protein